MSSVYCPPKHNMSEEIFTNYFKTLGPRFVVGGDWNSKHVHWGSRLNTTRGRELKKCLDKNNLTSISTSEPTHWPTDPNRLPDVIDFFIMSGLSRLFYKIESCLDGSTNHVPVILTLSTTIIHTQKSPKLYNRQTDWTEFRHIIMETLELRVTMKSSNDLDDAVYNFTKTVQDACWKCTPELQTKTHRHKLVPQEIRQLILEKRRLRRVWHTSRHPDDKKALNKAARELKSTLKEIESATTKAHLQSLTATSATNYSLWKVCKGYNQPTNPKPPLRMEGNKWARTAQEKANEFAKHLVNVFVPNEAHRDSDDTEIDAKLEQDFQLDIPLKTITPQEVRKTIHNMENKKAPGIDLIDKKVLKELPKKP